MLYQKRRNLLQDEPSQENEGIIKVDLKKRIIRLYGTITLNISAETIDNIQKFEKKHSPFTIEFNSHGGSYEATMGIISNLILCKSQIITDVKGIAYSAAAYLFLCGKVRKMSKVSILMFHDPLLSLDQEESIIQLKNYLDVSVGSYHDLIKLLLKDTKVSVDTYKEKARPEWYIGAQEALKLGLVHEIY